MPKNRKKPAAPAQGSGDGVDISIGGSGAGPASPGFGPNTKAARERGPGGHRSSDSHEIPPTWVRGEVAPDFNLPEEI